MHKRFYQPTCEVSPICRFADLPICRFADWLRGGGVGQLIIIQKRTINNWSSGTYRHPGPRGTSCTPVLGYLGYRDGLEELWPAVGTYRYSSVTCVYFEQPVTTLRKQVRGMLRSGRHIVTACSPHKATRSAAPTEWAGRWHHWDRYPR